MVSFLYLIFFILSDLRQPQVEYWFYFSVSPTCGCRKTNFTFWFVCPIFPVFFLALDFFVVRFFHLIRLAAAAIRFSPFFACVGNCRFLFIWSFFIFLTCGRCKPAISRLATVPESQVSLSTVASRENGDLRPPLVEKIENKGETISQHLVVTMWCVAARGYSPFTAAHPCPPSSARQDCDWDAFRQCVCGEPCKNYPRSRSQNSPPHVSTKPEEQYKKIAMPLEERSCSVVTCFSATTRFDFAFVTGNSSLEPLIEGLCAQIHVNLRWRVFGRNRTGDLTDY